MEQSTDMENLTGMTGQATSENSNSMTFQVKVSTPGAMEDATTASGKRIKCMDRASSNGWTVVSIMDRLLTIVKRAKEFLHGVMDASTMVNGVMANNMDRAFSPARMVRDNKVSGPMVKYSAGLTRLVNASRPIRIKMRLKSYKQIHK